MSLVELNNNENIFRKKSSLELIKTINEKRNAMVFNNIYFNTKIL